MISSYYQAQIMKDKIWLVTALLRNENHWVFDRTLDATNNILEFFVAPSYEEEFFSLMKWFEEKGYLLSFNKLPHRMIDEKHI